MALEPEVTLQDVGEGIVEDHGFLPIDGAQLAFARSRPWTAGGGGSCDLDRDRCIGRILLVGPIGAERERAHRTMVELSRRLAQRGYEVLRYDHRGIGESTGTFEEATIGLWTDDARRVLHAFRSTTDSDMPTTIIGVRIGALIVGALFAEGLGDAAIFIGEGDGRSLLRDASRRALVAGLVQEGPPQTGVGATTAGAAARASTGSSAVAAGAVARIDGYLWTPRLVEEAEAHRFPTPGRDEPRPWARLELSGSAMPKPTDSPTRNGRHRHEVPTVSTDCRRAGCSGDCASGKRQVHARRFWESSPRLVLEDRALLDAIGAHLERSTLARADARGGSGAESCTPR